MWKMNLNTCHVWAEDSEVVAKYAAGGTSEPPEPPEPPEFARERMVKLGISPSDWAQRMGL